MVKSDGNYIFLRCAEIDWIEAQGDYVKFHYETRSCLVRMKLCSVTVTLDPAKFLRIHRSTMVNIDRIERITPHGDRHFAVVLRDGTRRRISKTYRGRVHAFSLAALTTMRLESHLLTAPLTQRSHQSEPTEAIAER